MKESVSVFLSFCFFFMLYLTLRIIGYVSLVTIVCALITLIFGISGDAFEAILLMTIIIAIVHALIDTEDQRQTKGGLPWKN